MLATTGTEAASRCVKRRGFAASIPASATAYSALAPVKRAFVTPKTSSPGRNAETPGPTLSTTPDRSDPSVSGSGCGSALLPSLTHASHGPTPDARTRTSTWSVPGSDTATSSYSIVSTPPKR